MVQWETTEVHGEENQSFIEQILQDSSLTIEMLSTSTKRELTINLRKNVNQCVDE